MSIILAILIGLALENSTLAQAPPNGSLIFFKDGLLSRPIERFSGSSISHSAIVLYHKDVPFVYESTWPRARCMPWDDYQKFIAKRQSRPRMQRMDFTVTIMQPIVPFDAAELQQMQTFARSQMGRKYRMRNWWLNRDSKGTHCSQFISEVLSQSARYPSPYYWRESPGSLHHKISGSYASMRN